MAASGDGSLVFTDDVAADRRDFEMCMAVLSAQI